MLSSKPSDWLDWCKQCKTVSEPRHADEDVMLTIVFGGRVCTPTSCGISWAMTAIVVRMPVCKHHHVRPDQKAAGKWTYPVVDRESRGNSQTMGEIIQKIDCKAQQVSWG
jgi:hypothetical protein